MRSLVVIPTYNELPNIERLVSSVLSAASELDILIVDDNSPDGTGVAADKLAASNPRVRVLHRESKLGLGSAYVAGFKYALLNNFDFIFEMDADFSHNPESLTDFLEKSATCDLVIGSRYINGISVVNWPLRRLLLSIMASIYVRLLLWLPIKDTTSGFKCFRADILRSIDLSKVKSDGYAFQIEMNYRAYRNGFKICEIPIIFIERHSGSSKMSRHIVFEALLLPWSLRIEYLFKNTRRHDNKKTS